MRLKLVTMAVVLAAVLSGVLSFAAEITVRPRCDCQRPVVTLGDIAEIDGADVQLNEKLAALDLFPAPAAGRERFLSVREIQDMLVLRGVNIARHRFSGASRIAVSRSVGIKQAAYEKPITSSARSAANHRVHDAVVDYIKSNSATTKSWTVELELTPEQVRPLLGPVRQIIVGGGKSPWTGAQRFRITVVRQDQKPVEFEADAQVSLPPNVVVARRAIPRDSIITAADLQLCRNASADEAIDAFSAIEELVGQQAVRTISEGNVIGKQCVSRPLVVRRGEIVTVTARSEGIRVSTNARARGDGSLGDLIAVESLHDRKTFYARVCGTRETEIFAPTVRTRGVERPRSNGLAQPRSARNSSPKRFEMGRLQ